MAEVNPAELKSLLSSYQLSRALNDVLVGVDIALPLFEASSSGNITALKKILEDSPEIALESPHRIDYVDRPAKDRDDLRRVKAAKRMNIDRAILRAARHSHVEAVSTLLDFASRNGLKPSSVIDRDTVTVVLRNRDVALFEFLAAADPSVATHHGIPYNKRLLDWAIRFSDIKLIKIILRHGGGSSRSRLPDRYSRLGEAAKKTKPIVELLIQHGYVVKGSGALQAAAQSGKLDIARLLVEDYGANVNKRLPKEKVMRAEEDLYLSWTPLHWAGSQAKGDAIKLLEKL